MIYDFSEHDEWSDEIDDIRGRFASMDLVVGPGYGSFKTMYVVHEIRPDAEYDAIEHKGVFWERDEALEYAENRHERTHGYVEHADELVNVSNVGVVGP